MFKLESYITPLLLSYVDKYIKNFRAEDSQVSLWGGDVSFNNLDLRLEVLEEELQLPFTFISGHIHELLIHVPWTKITSEPITITINTIECILKLRGPETGTTNKERKRKIDKKKEAVEAPPGYIQSVINKIVANIKIYCNNLILKYVEEDIVFSMNVKLLTFESANSNWEPAYIDTPHGEVTLRKLIMINDLTICLDRRNASGKIEIYQEPILYRCTMAMRVIRNYYLLTARKKSITRFDIYCSNMEFSTNEQQVPMLMRILQLGLALMKYDFKIQLDNGNDNLVPSDDDGNSSKTTWAGWAWSVVPSIFPSYNKDDPHCDDSMVGHTLHGGFYVDNIVFTFKVSECIKDRGYYQQKKMKYWPVLAMNMQGVALDFVSHGKPWTNSTFGISEILLYPIGVCTCSHVDIGNPEQISEYLKAGAFKEDYKADSLFDPLAPENTTNKRRYSISWDQYIRTKTEEYLIENTPAVSVDFVHYTVIPDDISLSDLNPHEDHINFSEKCLTRIVFGPTRLRVCSGFFHRISTIQAAASTFDYQPYFRQRAKKLFNELPPPTADDFDALHEQISMRVTQITAIAPLFEFELMDHPYFKASKEQYFKPRIRKASTSSRASVRDMPKLTLEFQCIDAKITRPLHEDRVVQIICQLPDVEENMFAACHQVKSVKATGITSRLIIGSNKKYTTLIAPTNVTFYSKSIIQPEYWMKNDVAYSTIKYEADTITLNGTNPKLKVAYHILDKLFKMGLDETYPYLLNSSMFEDANREYSMPYLEYCLEGVKYKRIKTVSTQSYEVKLGAMRAFIFNPVDTLCSSSDIESMNSAESQIFYATRDIEQIMFISSGDEDTSTLSEDLISVIIQLPIDVDHQPHPPIVVFNMREIKVCLDPLFCKWLLYTPTVLLHKADFNAGLTISEHYQRKLKKVSELSFLETPKKITLQESVHSSSDRENTFSKDQSVSHLTDSECKKDIQERTYNFLKDWFKVWKGLILVADIRHCIIYLPIESLSAVGSKGIEETISQATKGSQPPHILVIKLPSTAIKSAIQLKNFDMHYSNGLPINVSQNIWNMEMYSFPWTISVNYLSIFTVQCGKELDVVKPTSISATVGLTTNLQGSAEGITENSRSLAFNNSEFDIGQLGVCVHVDITPVDVYLSEIQIYLLSSILYGLTEVWFNMMASGILLPLPKRHDKLLPTQNVSLTSLVQQGENSLGSTSDTKEQDFSAHIDDKDSQKLTAWIQTTMNKFSLTILSHKDIYLGKKPVYKKKPDLKMVIDAEDIVSSLDFQNVYLKIKSKVGSASIRHYEKTSHGFVVGPYMGIIMKAHDEEAGLSKNQEDTCFANITITRANCRHTHNLWGTSKKNKANKEQTKTGIANELPSRYITEIVCSLQPIDFIVAPDVLNDLMAVFQPLAQITGTLRKPKQKYEHKIHFYNTTLPLAHVEFKGFQFILPTKPRDSAIIHDMFILQIENINVSPNPENPICRNPSRPDIYDRAAQSRLLNIPGSDLEDRQYQFEINGMSFRSGKWIDFERFFMQKVNQQPLTTLSENPAVEWNNLKRENTPPSINQLKLWPFVRKFNALIIAAPAMVYKKVVVCHHAIEINFISDIDINVSLTHLKDLLHFQETLIKSATLFQTMESVHPRVVFPYQNAHFLPVQMYDDLDSSESRDSGFNTVDARSSTSLNRDHVSDMSMVHVISENEQILRVVSKPFLLTHIEPKVSFEVLITGGRISFTLCRFVEPTTDSSDTLLDNTPFIERNNFNVEPMLFVSLCQPNCSWADTLSGKRMSLIIFDLSIKIRNADAKPLSAMPMEDNFLINILETRPGEPDPYTGILPALLTMKWSKTLTKTTSLEVDFAKPTKIFLSVNTCLYFMNLYNDFAATFSKLASSRVANQPRVKARVSLKIQEQYSQFRTIRRMLHGISLINMSINQLVFIVYDVGQSRVDLSIGNFYYNVVLSMRPDRILNTLNFNYLTVGFTKDDRRRLLVNPWTFSSEITIFWEPWQPEDSDPQVLVNIESDTINIDISPNQIDDLLYLIQEITEFLAPYLQEAEAEKILEQQRASVYDLSNQHYKDDLRAGAFQFVDAQSYNLDELPLPYQVVFWHKKASAMAWRYPQPRTLTKVRVFPVPFNVAHSNDVATSSNESPESILCHLEYWSDAYNAYQPYAKFYLSESEMCLLELPDTQPKPISACVWRVVLGSADTSSTSSNSRVPISPHVLAGCLRVDSYFSKNLVPDLVAVVKIAAVNVSLLTNVDRNHVTLPDNLKEYNWDTCLPERQNFLTFYINNVNAQISSWILQSFLIDVTSDLSCSILDYTFLTNQTLIEPFNTKLTVGVSDTLTASFVSKPIRLKFGASAAHTLMISAQMWNKCITKDARNELVILTPYVICNNCNVPLKFGQTGYEEIIYLPIRYCHLYSWRSQKCKKMMRVSLETDNYSEWSEPFHIDEEGTKTLIVGSKKLILIVTVKTLSTTQSKVTFSGQFTIYNMLLEHFEFKIVDGSARDKDAAVKQATSYIVNAKSSPPTLLMYSRKKYFLRLRFFGLDSAWSGDIPMCENTKSLQPWLVKVPLQERGQFLSIWCKIVVENLPVGERILAVLWPLFMIRSNLPIESRIRIETPTLNVHLESTIPGHGVYQQLYCPGTIDHSHQITLNLDNYTPNLNPYIPLNYSLVDHKEFFRKPDQGSVSINAMIDSLNDFDREEWPFFDQNTAVEPGAYLVNDQPLTHVQVKYRNACPNSPALCVELLPWCLMLNTLGCQIGIFIDGQEICRVEHVGIVTPPKLEDTLFHIGVAAGNTWNMSPPLQLAKSDWGKVFYMPKIAGTIPLEGPVNTFVKCGPYISSLSLINTSKNGIRLIKVCSTHVIVSHLNFNINAICFAIPNGAINDCYDIPNHLKKHSFKLPIKSNEDGLGVSIVQWYAIGQDVDAKEHQTEFALYIAFSANPDLGWSCPVRVDRQFIRRGIAVQMGANISIPLVITSNEIDGQTCLAIHHDKHPQLQIINSSGVKLYFAEYSRDEGTAVSDCEHLKWRCLVDNLDSIFYTLPTWSKKFPEIQSVTTSYYLTIASDPEGDPQGFQWSQPVNLAVAEQFVRIPFYGDVKINVNTSRHTMVLRIKSAVQAEISAQDIRIRLSKRFQDDDKTQEGPITMFEDPVVEAKDIKLSNSSTTVASSYHTADEDAYEEVVEDVVLPKSSPSVLTTLFESAPEMPDADPTAAQSVLNLLPWQMTVSIFVQGFILTLTSDLEKGGMQRTEVANLICDQVGVEINKLDHTNLALYINDIQLDNQLYATGAYDFSVILVGQRRNRSDSDVSIHSEISHLLDMCSRKPMFQLSIRYDTWINDVTEESVTDVKTIICRLMPLEAYIEDVYMHNVLSYLKQLAPGNVVMWSKHKNSPNDFEGGLVKIPEHTILLSTMAANPLMFTSFQIEGLSLSLSVHSSKKVYIAIDQSPLQFGTFERRCVVTTPYRLGHIMTMHYLSGAIFGAGWVVGSLELLGSPGGLARAMGSGLRDFVSMPCYGLVQGPWAFLKGVTNGSASLMKHVTAGTLQSVTKLATSVARNLDRLTLDEEHLRRTEEQRRQKPQGLAEGFLQGLTGFGISLLGAIGGIAHHPLQSLVNHGPSTSNLISGVGLGLVGILTKPLSGAADLVALTGEGLLQGAGWNPLPQPRMNPAAIHMFSSPNALIKYNWKFGLTSSEGEIIYVTEANFITNGHYEIVALVLTLDNLVIINIDEDVLQRTLKLSELSYSDINIDPSLLTLKLKLPEEEEKREEHDDDDMIVGLNRTSFARVSDYVKSTMGLLHFPAAFGAGARDDSVDYETDSQDNNSNSEETLRFYVNPYNRNTFLLLLEICKLQKLKHNFPIF